MSNIKNFANAMKKLQGLSRNPLIDFILSDRKDGSGIEITYNHITYNFIMKPVGDGTFTLKSFFIRFNQNPECGSIIVGNASQFGDGPVYINGIVRDAEDSVKFLMSYGIDVEFLKVVSKSLIDYGN